MGLIKTGDRTRDKILEAISNMKYDELKRNCALRGLAPEIIVNADFPKLTSWLADHWDVAKNLVHLTNFDDWMDQQLQLRGHPKDSPLRRFKQMAREPEEPETPKEAPKKKDPPPPKKKREKDTKLNIYKGTKKELVYRLCQVAWDKFGKKYKYDTKVMVNRFARKVMVKVENKFPGGANEKSVRIWMKRALDAIRNEKKAG